MFRVDPWAEYAVLTVDAGRVALEFRRVPYDAASLVEHYLHSGRPDSRSAVVQYQRPPEQRPSKQTRSSGKTPAERHGAS